MEAPSKQDPAARSDPRVRLRGFVVLGAGVLLSLFAMALARFPGVVERMYASGIGPPIARSLSLLTGWIPFSVAMALAAALVVWAAVEAVRGVRTIRKAGSRAGAWLLVAGLSRVAGVTGVLLLLFYPLWGFNYARAPLDVRLGMAAGERLDAMELVELSREAARRTNEAYMELHGVEDAGTPTDGLVDATSTSRALESGWGRLADALNMGPHAARRYGPVKTAGVTWLIDLLDIAGIYVPYTGEAHVSGAQPDLSLPAVAAHEQAHQRGIARENEATFAGILAAIHSDDPMARYSGWARALRSLQADLRRVDPTAWAQEIRPALHPGVVRDWQDYIDYLVESRSAASPIVEATNDAYLRAHGVPGGIASYDRVTTLLLEWAHRHGGGLVLRETF